MYDTNRPITPLTTLRQVTTVAGAIFALHVLQQFVLNVLAMLFA